MKNAIIAIIVALAMVGSAVAPPVINAIGAATAVKNAVGITTDNAVKTAERKNNDYKADVSTVPAPDKTQIGDDEYGASVVVTDFTKGYAGDTPIYKTENVSGGSVNILITYCDPYALASGEEFDASLILTVNAENKKAMLTKVSNNLYVPIEGHEWNRLGAAFEYGGIGLYINTLNEVFGLDIQDYLIIDLTHADEAVDWLGGIDVTLDQAAVDHFKGTYSYTAGENHLNGKQFIDLVKAVKNEQINETEEMTRSIERSSEEMMKKLQNSSDISGLRNIVRTLLKSNMNALDIISLVFKLMPTVNSASDIQPQDITTKVEKAIVTVKETGKQIAVLIMESIEQVRQELSSRIYG